MSPAARWLWAAVGAAVVASVPFAWLRGPFLDGWMFAPMFERGAHSAVADILHAGGRPLAGLFDLYAMAATGSSHGAIWLAAASIPVACAAWYMAFVRSGLAEPRLAFAMAVLSAVVPANLVLVVIPAVHFYVAHALFAIGLWLFLEARLHGAGLLALSGAGACAVLSSLLGEATAMMLPLYPMVAFAAGDRGWLSWRQPLAAAKVLSPVVLGIAAFIAMFLLFPPSQGFAHERRLGLDPVQLALSALTFMVTVAVAWSLVWLVIGVARWRATAAQFPGGRDRRMLLALSAATAILSLAPFIIALRLANPAGWGIRYLYFFGSSVAWLAASLLATRGVRRRFDMGLRTAGWLVAAAVASVLVHLAPLISRAVHEDIVSEAALASPLLKGAHVVVIDDRTRPFGAPLRAMEWTGILQRALQMPAAIAGLEIPAAEPQGWDAWRLSLRRRMGWALPAQPPADEFMRDSIRALSLQPSLLDIPQASCRVVRLTIERPDSGRTFSDVGRMLQKTLAPDTWREWLRQQAAQQVRISDLPALSPCH